MAERLISDPELAARLLGYALGGRPALPESQMTDLVDLAKTTIDGEEVYTRSRLNEAAALGWSWKAALTADQYDVAGGNGKSLTRSQWWDHCRRMGDAYVTGTMDVIAGSNRGAGIGSLGLTTETAEVYPRPAVKRLTTLPPEMEGVVING